MGLHLVPVVGQLKNPRNVLIRISNEEDFNSVMVRGNSEVEGVLYRVFHWMPNFIEEEDSPWVPVWLTLSGLPPNYFHESILRSIGGGFGRFLKRDNVTACVTHSEAAHICVEMDVSKPLRHSFWLDNSGLETSHCQEVIFEMLPAFCLLCRKQDHHENKCLCRDLVQKKSGLEKKIEEKIERMKLIWEVVGVREKEKLETEQGLMVGSSSNLRRVAILDAIHERKEVLERRQTRVLFVLLNGLVHNKNQFDLVSADGVNSQLEGYLG
ncbi:uncharacterized protein LOC121249532 [Juglans microcarpa x Juglans regia]|uniref:uncharacterized protein LOC121249532 n=1 Tax=Juglans microcarpa x Juglans regia TaxID=2249226 RepID=UPI001B7EF9AC|nr:uncharacterized protein LOC121249532 [Juglans microcarpa x Juglans regia]